MKVLHVGEYVQGGVATYISMLLNHPHHLEINDYIVCSDKNSEHKWDLPEGHVNYYSYHRSVFQIFPAMISVWKEIRRLKPDVIYCHSTWAGLFARFPMLFLGKPCRVLYNAHGWSFLRDTAEWKRKVYACVERLLLCKTDAVINVSKYEYEAALRYGLPSRKQHIIYSGISEEKIKVKSPVHFSKNNINFLFVGRFDPQKGVDYLLKAFAKCRRRDIHLYLIGDNVIGSTQIEKKDTHCLTFLGWIPHEKVGNYYASCDAVIMPSRWEAFGLVAVEAMKYGKPVIASNCGALPEIVKNGENGYVFDFNRPEMLVDILEHIDSKALVEMGRKAEKDFQNNYKMERMIEETICLIKKYVKEK